MVMKKQGGNSSFLRVAIRSKDDLMFVRLLANPKTTIMEALEQIHAELSMLYPLLRFNVEGRVFVFSHYEVLCSPEIEDSVFIRLWFSGSLMVAPISVLVHIDSSLDALAMNIEGDSPRKRLFFSLLNRRLAEEDVASSCPLFSCLAYINIISSGGRHRQA